MVWSKHILTSSERRVGANRSPSLGPALLLVCETVPSLLAIAQQVYLPQISLLSTEMVQRTMQFHLPHQSGIVGQLSVNVAKVLMGSGFPLGKSIPCVASLPTALQEPSCNNNNHNKMFMMPFSYIQKLPHLMIFTATCLTDEEAGVEKSQGPRSGSHH